MKFLALLAVGFEETEAVTVIDLLSRAGFLIKIFSAIGTRSVIGAHGICLQSDEILSKAIDMKNVKPSRDDLYAEYDALFIPGGMKNVTALSDSADVLDLIRFFYNANKYITAICAAPLVLAAAGIMNGVKFTCYPGCENSIIQRGGVYLKDTVVHDKKIITSQGIGTAFSFALSLITLLKGTDAGRSVAEAALITDY